MPRSTRTVRVIAGTLVGGVFLVLLGGPGQLVVAAAHTGLVAAIVAAAVAVAFSASVALAPWLPVAALAAAWAAALGQMAAGLPLLPVDVAVLVVLFTAGASRLRALRTAGLASAIAGALLATAYLAWPSIAADARPAFLLAGLLLVASLVTLVLAWTFGVLLATLRRARDARAAAAAAEREAIAAEERGRIARDMHDVVAHSLAVIVAQADGARYLAADERSASTLATISAVAREALGDVRVLLERLRYRQGELPQPGAGEIAALVEQVRATGLDVRYEVEGVPERLPAAADLALYRIVQEALTNALRHGDAMQPVRVSAEGRGDAVRLEVRSALREGLAPGEPGQGLLGMRERARLAGGELATRVEDGAFVVLATLPARSAERVA